MKSKVTKSGWTARITISITIIAQASTCADVFRTITERERTIFSPTTRYSEFIPPNSSHTRDASFFELAYGRLESLVQTGFTGKKAEQPTRRPLEGRDCLEKWNPALRWASVSGRHNVTNKTKHTHLPKRPTQPSYTHTHTLRALQQADVVDNERDKYQHNFHSVFVISFSNMSKHVLPFFFFQPAHRNVSS